MPCAEKFKESLNKSQVYKGLIDAIKDMKD